MEIFGEMTKSLIFVAQADSFYQAMAAVTIVSMLIGSLIYNGDLNQLKKAALTISSYGGMIILTNISRILSSDTGIKRAMMLNGQAFNGTTTVIYVTLFYIIGIALGVWVHKHARKESNKNNA
jgi:hypothetical protein